MVAQLSVATPWSFHWGASRVEELAAIAARGQVHALGMADLNGMWGAVPFQKACLQQGVKPLFGMRLLVEGVSAQVLAHDARGWAALCRLATKVQMALHPAQGSAALGVGHQRIGMAPFLLEALQQERETCGLGQSFSILSHSAELLHQLIARGGKAGLHVAMRSGARGQHDAQLGENLGLPLVACPAVAFAVPQDFERHQLLVAIGRNTNLSRLPASALACADPRQRAFVGGAPPAWLRNELELQADYRYQPQALAMAQELAQRCNYEIPLGIKRMPRLALPSDPKGDPNANPKQHADAANAALAEWCEAGITRRNLVWNEDYGAQLDRELKLIREQDLADYFLIVADIVRWTNQQGIQNCGRGSAANSLVSYLLGFTHIDPLRHDLWFDRFLHRGRRDFPDVDLDFAWDERDRVLDYMYRRHGRNHVAMLATHVTFGARGAVRELAKAMGVPPMEITPVTKALPWMRGGFDVERIKRNPKTANLPLDAEPWRTILKQAAALDGFPRHLGVHAGGMVLAPTELTGHLPLQHAKKETEDGRIVITQWDMGPVEEAGLLKIDLLGNRGLAVVRDAQRLVRTNTGLKVQFGPLNPKDDVRTQELIARGDTMGCFYIESPSMRSLLLKLQCRDFPTLVAASSIIRPGISSSGMMQAYIERNHAYRCNGQHHDDWYLHPMLQDMFAETYGVMAYQEDVLRVAQRLAGMTAADADGLRKAMTKKGAHKRLPEWRESLLQGLQDFGLSHEAALELWRQIESFAGYSFCKAHSASYAEVSFRSAYLRAHHPAEFMAAVLRNHGGFYATFAYVAEALRMGLKVLLPCVNRGSADFSAHGKHVRTGLREIQGIHGSFVKRVVEQREQGGPFIGMEDFTKRLRPQREELDSLVRAGALDGMPDGYTRPERMRWAALYKRAAGASLVQEARLFDEPSVPEPPAVGEFSRQRLLAMEEQALGYLVSSHPLELHKQAIRAAHVLPARELPQNAGKTVRLVGWQVTQKPVRTKHGDSMLFLSFEDTTALYETVMFPQVYKCLAPWTLTRGPYVLEGIARQEYGSITVEVNQLWLLRDYAVATVK
ncbi:MAG: DNA polymerase III subunit alpha [Planctomycetes bacterium]|nr:DNA polymerase III subunit alpha [Planctomycetota bacterium]MCP4772217.1 DNA polymerase III subunit alpha [Planctomycetota bacterium]MCP4861273.1 DNA polymerase III subunit alpha [Planctomycetota bacterium]